MSARRKTSRQHLVAQFLPKRDMGLLENLQFRARRVRKNLQLLTDDMLSPQDRRLANESFEHFSALRMLTADVIGRIRAGEEQLDPSAAQASAAIAQALFNLL